MVAVEITSQKQFMNQLLATEAFDIFLLEEATIKTAATYTVDGFLNKDFFTSEDDKNLPLNQEFIPWSEMKGLCFQLIKGKRTPLLFKLVLHLKPEQTEKLLQKAGTSMDAACLKALVLTVKYDGAKTILTTAASYHTFVMDKSGEQLWDKALMQYLNKLDISFERL